jgi:ABC-type phosphate transport system permease subunit
MGQYSFYIIIALISLAFAAVTILLGRKKVKRAILKYIPAMTAFAATLALIIKTAWFSEGFEGLGYAILAMITAILFLVSIITAIVVEIINRRRKRRQ